MVQHAAERADNDRMESAVADTDSSRAAVSGTLVIAPNRCRSALYALILGCVGVAAAVESPTVSTVAIDIEGSATFKLPRSSATSCGLIATRSVLSKPLTC